MHFNSLQSLIVITRISINALKRVKFSLKHRFNEGSTRNSALFLKICLTGSAVIYSDELNNFHLGIITGIIRLKAIGDI